MKKVFIGCKIFSILSLTVVVSFAMFSCSFGSLLKNSTQSDQPVAANNDASETTPTPIETTKFYNNLTGLACDEATSIRRPVSICIGNTASSMPQYGLSSADVLLEAPVENGITRLMMISKSYQDLRLIGSIRSTRPYFMTFSDAFGAVSAYAGTTDTQGVQNTTYKDSDTLDYIMQNLSSVYLRDSLRTSPHNVMTRGDLLSKAVLDYGYAPLSTSPLPYNIKEDIDFENASTAKKVSLYFSSLTQVEYTYRNGMYYRAQNGQAHMDEQTNEQLSAKNLFVLYCNYTTYTSHGEANINFDTLEGGTGYYFVDGKCVPIYWGMEEAGTMIFYDEKGVKLDIAPGKSYIGIVKVTDISAVTWR